MPKLGKGTDCIKLLLSQVSKDMREPIVPMLFPILGAHVSEAKFQYPDRSWKELCGMMANLVADSGGNKGQLSNVVEAICRDFRRHDDCQLKFKTKSAHSEKPARPEIAFWFPPADVTNAAYIQNSMACEKLGGRTQFLNLPEVEMADRICGGHRQVSQMIRNLYDCQRAGALRATAIRSCARTSPSALRRTPHAVSTRTNSSTAPSAASSSPTRHAPAARDASRARASTRRTSTGNWTSIW